MSLVNCERLQLAAFGHFLMLAGQSDTGGNLLVSTLGPTHESQLAPNNPSETGLQILSWAPQAT